MHVDESWVANEFMGGVMMLLHEYTSRHTYGSFEWENDTLL